jgi:nucleoside-diphosphate-sugar epimerase
MDTQQGPNRIGASCAVLSAYLGFKGEIVCDPSKPDGTPRKLVSGAKLAALGWRPALSLREGLADAYKAFLDELAGTRGNASLA